MERLVLSRRRLIKGTVATALALTLDGVAPASLAQAPITTEQAKFFSVFGIHDTPNDGGSQDVGLAIDDVKTLGAKHLFAINPSELLIERTLTENINIISRICFTDSIFNEEQITKTMIKLKSFLPYPVVQPFNEVNNIGETGHIPRTPERHAEELIAAIDLISSFNGITLITPMDQRAMVYLGKESGLIDYEYLERLTAYMKLLTPNNWLKDKVAIASHCYTHINDRDRNDFDPSPRIRIIDKIVQKNLGFQPEHYATEAGPYQSIIWPYSQEYYARETVRILDLPLPDDVQLKCLCFWVLANKAQRPFYDRLDVKQRGFEVSAWRGEDGPNLVYQKVMEYASVRQQQ